MPDVIIRSLNLDRDAQGIAELFNASNIAWPGGFTEGIPITGQVIREWIEEERNLVVYVAEADGQIVGFCTFMEGTPWPSSLYGVGYLGLLNVHPDHHGNSVGRRLIQATIDRSVQEGWVHQTLGTWSANFKAVPAYKKTGHFWRPDSSVWMQNFIPGALQMSLARPFFERHDWYSTYVREVKQCEDDERWEGLKVYRQHWEADGESLTIWIDREALAPCAIETDEVLVAAIVQDLEPLQGSTTRINWRIQNKRDAPLRAHVHAMGADGLEIDHREGFVVPPGLTVEHVAAVKVTDKAPSSKPNNAAPAVRSIVTLDHHEVELFSGMRARKPLSVDFDPGRISLPPGRKVELALQLHSELDEPVHASLYIVAPDDLQVDWREQKVALEPKGHLRLPFDLMAESPGVHTLHVRLVPDDKAMNAVKEDLVLFCLKAGQVLAHHEGESVRMETDTVRLNVAARNGDMRLTHKESELSLLHARPAMGPPYFPGDFDKNHFALTLEPYDGRAVVRMTAEPQYHPETLMQQVIELTSNGLVTVEQQLENRGVKAYDKELALEVFWEDREQVILTTPLEAGYVQAQVIDYPKFGDDAPRQPEAYTEPWIAVQDRGVAGGIAWGENTSTVRHEWQARFLSRDLDLSTGERSPVMRYALWTGTGDWRAAREALLHWAGQPGRGKEPVHLETRPVNQARLAQPVLATTDDTLESRLLVDSVSIREMRGKISLEAERDLTITPQSVQVESLRRGRPLEERVTLHVPDAPGRYAGAVRLDLPYQTSVEPFEVLRLGNQQDVIVQEGELEGQSVWVIDNGTARLTVAPDFGPSVVSWIWRGTEQLESAFPETRGHGFQYPWYGGIHLTLRKSRDNEACGGLVNDRFETQPVQEADDGVVWQGIRQMTRPQRKELHDFEVAFDYLTLGNSPVLKVVYRLTNLRATSQEARLGGVAVFSLGGAMERLALRGENYRRDPTEWGGWRVGETWGLMTDPRSRVSVLGTNPQHRMILADYGSSGRYLALGDHAVVKGYATHELVWYLALGDSIEAAEAFRSLASL